MATGQGLMLIDLLSMTSDQHTFQSGTDPVKFPACLSLVDGYFANCQLVYQHNKEIGAPEDEVLSVPSELSKEFQKLSPTIKNLGRAFELGLFHD
jgi:hypothetical protein